MRPETATWLAMADEDWAAAHVLLRARLYRSTVFHIHLAMEKTLKACVWEASGTRPPETHFLTRLAALAGVTLTDQRGDFLDTLSPLGVIARYAETSTTYSRVACLRLMRDAEDLGLWLRQDLT